MRTGIIAKKLGMTRFFREDGSNVPVTLIGVEKNYVTWVKEISPKNLKQIQIASGNIKVKKITKPIRNYFSKLKIEPKKKILEFKVANDQNINLGDTLDVNFFKVGQYVDVIGKSNGKGFAGSMKRHNFSGLRASHGVSVSHRAHGSTGQNQDPGKVFKGKKMAGHMGDKFRTIQNLEIIKSDLENSLIFVKGSVPGSKNSIVLIQKNSKKINRITTLEKSKQFQTESVKQPAKTKEKEKTPIKKKIPN